jgi:hypothetical protein
MIKVIQDLDSVIQQEQAWIENTEKAVRWTAFVLEEALQYDNPIENQNLESVYRNAIQTALRHLRTIEHSHSTTDRQTTRSGDNDNDEKVLDRLNRRKSSVPPNEALKEWLEKASMMSPESSKTIDVGTDIDDEDFYDNFSDNDYDNEYDEEKERAILDMYLDTKIDQDDEEIKEHGSEIAPASKAGRRVSIQTPTKNHRLSSASLKTGLDGIADERNQLKQHIQALDQLRVQEQGRHQQVEQAHQRLIANLAVFSKELLQGVNELTCAQATLSDASEMTLMTLKNAENGSPSVYMGGASADSAKRKRMVASSRKGITDSVTMVDQGIKRMRTLAADCVGIMELAQSQCENSREVPTVPELSPLSPVVECTGVSHVEGPSDPKPLSIQTAHLQEHQSSLMTPTTSVPSTPLAMRVPMSPSLDQKSMAPSSIFIDGIALQEFEAHVASLRAGQDSISKKIQRRLSQRKSFIPSSVVQSPTLNVDPNSFLKRVLAEDIYPCLHIHPGTTPVKQSSWMSSFLSSSTTFAPTAPSTCEISTQSPWRQQLLKALENNTCEIESWRMMSPTAVPASATPTTPKPVTTTDNITAAPSATCFLCGLSRPCEFKLRIMDMSESNESSQHHPLDRFCRDKIVAVGDFYTFLTHLRQGLLDHQSNLELFRRALWLRQRIGCARMGSMDIMHVNSDTIQRRSIASIPSLATVRE